MDKEQVGKLLLQVREVFTPSAPVRSRSLFAGRLDELIKLRDTINTRGKHSIIYGERGVGKTSLANVISEVFSTAMFVSKVSCNRSDKFASLWSKALNKITLKITKPQIGFNVDDKEEIIRLSNYLINNGIDVNQISSLLTEFSRPTLLIFDEFDTVIDDSTKSQFADLIKDLSDNNPLVTILIVGIGDNIIQLIGKHPSVARCLGQIHLPRMSKREIGSVIDNGVKILGMNVDGDVKNTIIKLSQGFPYYTHLIMEYTTTKTLQMESLRIKMQHLEASIFQAVTDIDQITKDIYEKAIDVSQSEVYKSILFACAMCGDDQGQFRCQEVLDKYDLLSGSNGQLDHSKILYRLNKLCTPALGEILEKATKMKYRFKNPLVKAYINILNYNEEINEVM